MPITEIAASEAGLRLGRWLEGAAYPCNEELQGDERGQLMAAMPGLCQALYTRTSILGAPGRWSWIEGDHPFVLFTGLEVLDAEALLVGFGRKPTVDNAAVAVTAGVPHAELFGPGGTFPIVGALVQCRRPSHWPGKPSEWPDKAATLTLVLDQHPVGQPGLRWKTVQFTTWTVLADTFGVDGSGFGMMDALQDDGFPWCSWSPADYDRADLATLARHTTELGEFLAYQAAA